MTFEDRVREKLRFEEGVRRKVYRCSRGFLTIGVGENLERDGAREHLAALLPHVDFDRLREGKIDLTDAQIEILLDAEIVLVLADLHALFDDFEQMPEDVRVVLTDMRYQLGAAGLRGFKNTLNMIRNGDFKEAAAGLRKSLLYTQTPKRAETNAQLLEQA